MSKRLFLLTLLLSFVATVVAQDVITLKNGDEINGKVTKVTSTEIEYKLASNPNGPTYTKAVSEIFMVKYENGQKDVFNNTTATDNGSNQMQPSEYTLERHKGRIVSTAGDLTDDQLEMLLGREQFKEYKKLSEEYVSQTSAVVFTIGCAIAGPIMMWLAPYADSQTLYAMYLGVGIAFTAVGNIMTPICFVSRGIRAGKISRIAEAYNAKNGSLGMEISGGFTLMPTAQGTVAPGLGLSLRF